MNTTSFRDIIMWIDPYFELVHGNPHFWIGGPMAVLEAAPMDPVFFLHHNFIDLMWDAHRATIYEKYGREGMWTEQSQWPSRTICRNDENY